MTREQYMEIVRKQISRLIALGVITDFCSECDLSMGDDKFVNAYHEIVTVDEAESYVVIGCEGYFVAIDHV